MAFSLVFYNAILLLSTLFVWLSEKASTPMQRKVCTLIAFLIVFLPAALRYEIGIDYFSYKIIFENIRDGLDPFWQSKMEPGFYFLNWMVANLGLGFEWLVGLTSLIIFTLFFLTYPKKYKAYYHFLLITLVYFTANNLLRNWLALGFVWLAVFSYLKEPRLFRFLVLIFIGSLFHKSVILFLAFPLLAKLNIFARNKLAYIFVSLLIIFLALWSDTLIKWLMSGSLSQALGYARYSSGWYAQDTELGSGIGVLIKILFLAYPLLWLNTSNPRDDFASNKIIILLIWIAIISIIAAAKISIFHRMAHLFAFVFNLILLWYLLNKKVPFSRVAVWLFLTFMFLTFNKSILDGSTDYMETCRGARITPYISVFNKEDSTRDPHLTRFARWCDAYFENK